MIFNQNSDSQGWMEKHPEEQVYVDFEDFGTVPLFRNLTPEEEISFRKHARETYVIGTDINPVNHPVWRDEARLMNEEAGNV